MIKSSSRLIFAAIAATAALAACTIAMSFAPHTKTALCEDGLTPEFTGQDEWIKVSNSEKSEAGRFADANICMAENITDAAAFVNQTAILKFYVGEALRQVRFLLSP